MKYKIENLKLKIKEAVPIVLALAIMFFSTGCAEFVTNDARRFTDSDYSTPQLIDLDNAWKTDEKIKENEPPFGSNEWCIKYRAVSKVLSTGFLTGMALAGQESNKEIVVPIFALIGYGIASMPISWEKDGDWYKWPVIGGAAAGLTAGVVMIVQNKLYEGQYGWEGLICFGTAFLSTCIGTGIGGIVGDIANAVDMSNKSAKNK
jgi:hypothetical protein